MWYQNIGGMFHCSFVLSQSTRVMDRRTDRRTDGQNFDPQDHFPENFGAPLRQLIQSTVEPEAENHVRSTYEG